MDALKQLGERDSQLFTRSSVGFDNQLQTLRQGKKKAKILGGRPVQGDTRKPRVEGDPGEWHSGVCLVFHHSAKVKDLFNPFQRSAFGDTIFQFLGNAPCQREPKVVRALSGITVGDFFPSTYILSHPR